MLITALLDASFSLSLSVLARIDKLIPGDHNSALKPDWSLRRHVYRQRNCAGASIKATRWDGSSGRGLIRNFNLGSASAPLYPLKWIMRGQPARFHRTPDRVYNVSRVYMCIVYSRRLIILPENILRERKRESEGGKNWGAAIKASRCN